MRPNFYRLLRVCNWEYNNLTNTKEPSFMPWSTATPVYLWAVIFLPVFVLLFIFTPKVRLTAVLISLSFFAASFYCVLAINWAVINYWLRVVPAILPLAL